MKKKVLLSTVLALTMGSAMAQSDHVIDLLPNGVTTDINPERRTVKEKNLVVAGSEAKGYKAYFAATDDEHGTELWVTDGTKDGTKMVADILPGSGSSSPAWLCRLGEKVLFSAYTDNEGRQLWVTDGTEAGTQLIAQTYEMGDGNPQAIYQINETQAVFAAISDESAEYDPDNGAQYWLWITDGTKEGTKFVKQVKVDNPGKENTNQHSAFVRVGRRLFFKADDIDGHYGTELWVTDGTEAGTYLVKDINKEPNTDKGDGYTRDSAIDCMENYKNGKLFFKAWTMESGNELWASDGTEAGTYQVYDANPAVDPNNGLGVGPGVFGEGWEVYKDRIWFRGWSSSTGFELVGSNLEEGDYQVFDYFTLNPSQDHNSFPDPGCVFQDKYVFCGADGFDANADPVQHGGEMLIFDGETITRQTETKFPGTLCNWVKEPIVAGGSLYWMNEANNVDQGLGSGLYRLDDLADEPVVVPTITTTGDNVNTLRNLNGTILYVCGANNRLYADEYTKVNWDGQSDKGYMEPDFGSMPDAIKNMAGDKVQEKTVNVYTINGTQLHRSIDANEAAKGLKKGIYIIGNKKHIVL
ncbi:ELWxxDGT repeat protein [Xylanibacter brevis]|uniref:ELWxxDGT repeat protein n=1 Tax=Xylanibacter brevis TaxID=83231 RepID=UPI0004886163|nr:ELWxxDGT repeat protein [Xylanibacter brevis]